MVQHRVRRVASLCAASFALCLQQALAAPDEAVRIDAGVVSGITAEDGVRVFKGIPFAAPPVGELRWRPPQPCARWEGVRTCDTFGPSCPQPKPVLGPAPTTSSEDCLYLNVWTGAQGAQERRPVMVWIHGGGYTTGSGSSPLYDGSALARRGVVVVTINYRLGPFGFLAHPLLSQEAESHSSGNYGLLDQIAALQWVKGSIAAFGGDPDCVTIFGESAGAGSVACLLASPLARGLCHRAIMESGFAQARRLNEAERIGTTVAQRLGCDAAPDPLAAMRGKSAEEVLQAANPAQGLFGKGLKFLPTVDGLVLTEEPRALFSAGKQAAVPIIAGSNADDGSIFSEQLTVKTVQGYGLILRGIFANQAGRARELFPAETDADVPAALGDLITVAAFVAPARFTVSASDMAAQDAYLYHFTRIPPALRSTRYGAMHGAEIPYVFGSLVRAGEETDRQLSEAMGAYWVQFATTGDPNREGLAPWPKYDQATDRYLELGDSIVDKSGLHKEACDLLEQARGRRGRLGLEVGG